MMDNMSSQGWREGRCAVLWNFYPGETFLTFEETCEEFTLGPDLFLNHASVDEIAKMTWPSYHATPKPTHTLGVQLSCATGKLLVTLIHKAMVADAVDQIPWAHTAWDADLETPLDEGGWVHVCELTGTVSCNARIKLVHYSFLHRTNITPMDLHWVSLTRPDSCPYCGASGADFLHLSWNCPAVQSY
ncbi:hypothetical protein NDU88_000127 [Pleurodeles waltl]|uniref:Reverse transcriptase zinc-binding domain-containing protein n=1 Tax=Pleurodeles waltl TaxID=8319 RepID=A0AAV7KUS5_PLEWA|nr:hypothetical protein NDU88_000127 [Pleurodeles waltl]